MQIILGIETSCDNTAVAIVDINKKVLFTNNYHQDDVTRKYGGYIPHILINYQATNMHNVLKNINNLFDLNKVDCIAVTCGPGMIFSLSIGYKVALMLNHIYKKPLFFCDHIEGHIMSPFIEHAPVFPYLCVVISGGHCLFVLVKNVGDYQLIGQTVDDSPGEVLDKVARELSLEFYNGYYVSLSARSGSLLTCLSSLNVRIKDHKYCCSFAGFKTRVINAIRENKYSVEDICFTVQYLVMEHILRNVKKIYSALNLDIPIAFAGGVAANYYLRQKASAYFEGIKLLFTDIKYAGDNGEMIANLCIMYLLNGDGKLRQNTSNMCYSKEPYDMLVFKR